MCQFMQTQQLYLFPLAGALSLAGLLLRGRAR